MTINEIYNNGEISIRSYHICKESNLEDLRDLIGYYIKYESFKKIKGCGDKSNRELIKVCVKYQDLVVIESIEDDSYLLGQKISELTRTQRNIINNFILVEARSLSKRSGNAITSYLEGNFNIKNFARRVLLLKKFNLDNIKGIGAKSIAELEEYITNVRDFVIKVSQSDNERELSFLKNNFLIQRTFGISSIPREILESESIFSVVDFLLKNNVLFEISRANIIKRALKLHRDYRELTLTKIAEDVDVTRERVRQIRKVCAEELLSKLSFIQNFKDDLFQKYNIDVNSNYLEIDDETIDRINKLNNTNQSREFITYILFAYLRDKFLLIGAVEDVLYVKCTSRKRHNWTNFHLIDGEIAKEIDFTRLVNDIYRRLNDKIEASYSFNFKSYLSNFVVSDDLDTLDIACPICEKLINEEFRLYLDLDGNLVFNRNTKKQAYEYAYEALECLGRPSKVKEIFEKIRELHPSYENREVRVRSSMKREKGFVPIGRESLFGLKKWENELENFKGGTIRDIVIEYLSQFSEPKHIEDITEHVLIYRPESNPYSIEQNLKLDESGEYVFYRGRFVGLARKQYDDKYMELRDVTVRKTWEERLIDFKNFTQKEGRLPVSKSIEDEELRLYRWLNVQKSKMNKGELDGSKANIINDIINQFF